MYFKLKFIFQTRKFRDVFVILDYNGKDLLSVPFSLKEEPKEYKVSLGSSTSKHKM